MDSIHSLPNGTSYLYQYYLKDHLGNTRVTLGKNMDGTAKNLQENEYYSYGLAAAATNTSSPPNCYFYNGKEAQTDLLNQYDYGARFYDPMIVRFTVIDAYAEKYSSMTPYQYGALNPIKNIDINGDSLRISNNGQNYLYQNGKLYQNGAEYTGKVKGFLKDAVNALGKINRGKEGTSMLSDVIGK